MVHVHVGGDSTYKAMQIDASEEGHWPMRRHVLGGVADAQVRCGEHRRSRAIVDERATSGNVRIMSWTTRKISLARCKGKSSNEGCFVPLPRRCDMFAALVCVLEGIHVMPTPNNGGVRSEDLSISFSS